MSHGPDLARFRAAQDDAHAGFAAALRELRAGRKTGHWIWYVFPQLAGLGQSPTAVHFGLADAGEAAHYLRDPVLGARLVEAVAAVHTHATGPRPVRLETLMGSHVDALKLVSCLPLFGHVARTLDAGEPHPVWKGLIEQAEAILAVAAAQGFPACRFTEEHLENWRTR